MRDRNKFDENLQFEERKIKRMTYFKTPSSFVLKVESVSSYSLSIGIVVFLGEVQKLGLLTLKKLSLKHPKGILFSFLKKIWKYLEQ